MINFEKIEKKITTNAEVLDLKKIFKKYNETRIYNLLSNNEQLYTIHTLIEEFKEQYEYKSKTGNNFFMVIIKFERIDVYKNGSWFRSISSDSVKINKDNTIDVKYIPTLQRNDYVEFYLDD